MAEEEKDGLLLRLPDNLMISIPSLSLARAIDTARVCCDLLTFTGRLCTSQKLMRW